MKPRIRVYFGPGGVRKWMCTSPASGNYGYYVRQGCGYTPREAYRSWGRCPSSNSPRKASTAGRRRLLATRGECCA